MTDASDRADAKPAAGGNKSAIVMALAVMALGVFVAYDTVSNLTGPSYAEVGPGAFPLIMSAALLLAGLGLLVQSLRGQWRVRWVEGDLSSAHARPRSQSGVNSSGHPEVSPAALGPRLRGDERISVAIIAGALTLNVFLFAPLGFIAASAVLFTCASAAFGSRRYMIDAAIGIAFAAAIYVIFVHGLGLSLPAGSLWEGVLWRR